MRATIKWLLSASLLFSGTAIADDAADMNPYPAAGDGFARMVFRVPPEDNEADLRVEILIGLSFLFPRRRVAELVQQHFR